MRKESSVFMSRACGQREGDGGPHKGRQAPAPSETSEARGGEVSPQRGGNIRDDKILLFVVSIKAVIFSFVIALFFIIFFRGGEHTIVIKSDWLG